MTKNVIYACYAGSLAYGTNLPTSDVDIRGIFCADPINIRTPFYPVSEVNIPDAEDGKLYELTNFMKLFTDMNPNIIELLFTDKDSIITDSEAYNILREIAPKLLSKKVAFTFSGYAASQLKRIKGHDKWINNPQPVEKPSQLDFLKVVHSYSSYVTHKTKNKDLKTILKNANNMCSLVPYGDNIYAVVEDYENAGVVDIDKEILKVTPQEDISELSKSRIPLFIIKYLVDEHTKAKDNHKNYWTWKENRNEKRHALEVQFGYDTKHAMHLVRLLRMGEEILKTGEVLVKRPDAKELLDIRNGAWALEDLLKWAEEKDNYIRGSLYRDSKLPKNTDIKLAAKTLMNVQDICWR